MQPQCVSISCRQSSVCPSQIVGLILPSLCSVFLQVALAEICAKCERYIGTEGGGMDQSISFLAEKGTVCCAGGITPIQYRA